MTNRKDILDELERERDYQDNKWGPPSSRKHQLPSWLLIMRSLVDDAEKEWMMGSIGATKRKILQTAAVGVAALELCGLVRR